MGERGVEKVMSGIDLQGVLFGPQRSGMFGCGGTSTEQVRVADDTWEEKSAEVKVVVIPEDANTYYLPEITSVEVEDLMAVTDFAAGEAETIAQEEGVAFCNLPKDLTTNIAVLPICIRRPETDEFKYKSLDSNAPAAITVNGIPIALYPACFDPFWGDAYLNLGENSIVGSLAYQGGESYQVEIKV